MKACQINMQISLQTGVRYDRIKTNGINDMRRFTLLKLNIVPP